MRGWVTGLVMGIIPAAGGSIAQWIAYAWEIRREGELVMPGFDVTELDDEGRVLRVLGFFGPLPEKDD